MKKTLLTAFTLALISSASFGQGLIFDSAAFAKRENVEPTRAELPLASSLKKYTPLLYPQVGSTCVGHSFSNARTILLAKSRDWTDKQKITALSFSPYYIYYRNKDAGDVGCENGLNIETAAKDVLKNGFAPIVDVEYPNYYPFTGKALCVESSGTSYPPSMTEDEARAKKFKVDEIYRVTSVRELKTALAAGMPVVGCMFVPPSFAKVKSELWTPLATDRLDRNTGHAILIVGYDDTKFGGAVELMNSWGEGWANKGFVWVKYKDYLKWFVGGYAFYVEENVQLKAEGGDVFTPTQAVLSTSTMKVNRGKGQYSVNYNNSEFIKAFGVK